MALTQENRSREDCIALREQGYSLRGIAERLSVSASTVRYHTRRVPAPFRLIPRPKKERLPGEAVRLEPSEDLAYFWGIFSGDGSLTNLPRTCQLNISCGNDYPFLIERYADLLERLFGKKPGQDRRKNWTNLRLYLKILPEILEIPCGKKSENGFSVPEWIWSEPGYVTAFLRGLIETDGGIYRIYHRGGEFWQAVFTATVPAVMEAFQRSVVYLGYSFRRSGAVCRLSKTAEVLRLIEDLKIEKVRQYQYLTK